LPGIEGGAAPLTSAKVLALWGTCKITNALHWFAMRILYPGIFILSKMRIAFLFWSGAHERAGREKTKKAAGDFPAADVLCFRCS
jgi:hypothetical protein